MSNPLAEHLGDRILGHAQDLPVAEAGQAAGARDQEEAERSHAPEGVRVLPFPRPGLEKKVPDTF
jgi:hypothetical protein